MKSGIVWLGEGKAIVGCMTTGPGTAVTVTIETNDSGAFAILTAFVELPTGGWQPRERIWVPVEQCLALAAAMSAGRTAQGPS